MPTLGIPGLRRVLDQWGWLLLVAAGPLLLFPSAERSLALLAAPLVVWVQQRTLRRTPLDWPILLLALMTLVSLYATYDIVVSLPKIAGVLLGVAVYYTAARWGVNPKGWWSGLVIFAVGGVAIAVIGLLATRWTSKISALQPIIALLPARLIGLFGGDKGIHPNEVAGALLWVIPLLLMLLALVVRQAKTMWAVSHWRWVGLLTLLSAANGLALLTLLLTQSRSSYLGLALALLLMVIVALPFRGRLVLLGSVLVLSLAGGIVISQVGVEALLPGEGNVEISDDPALSLNTLEGRMEIWSRALYGLQDFPFTGMGMNTFRQIVHVLYPLFLIGPDVDIGHAHNEFLQAGLDLGIPGLIAFVALYLGAFWMLFEIWRNRVASLGTQHSALILGLGGGLLAHLLYGLTDAVALGAKPGVLFWMLLGLIAGLYRQAMAHSN